MTTHLLKKKQLQLDKYSETDDMDHFLVMGISNFHNVDADNENGTATVLGHCWNDFQCELEIRYYTNVIEHHKINIVHFNQSLKIAHYIVDLNNSLFKLYKKYGQ